VTEQVKFIAPKRRLNPCTLADTRCAMVGIRMTTDREREVRIEAAQRGLSVAVLFDEIWTDYVDLKLKQ